MGGIEIMFKLAFEWKGSERGYLAQPEVGRSEMVGPLRNAMDFIHTSKRNGRQLIHPHRSTNHGFRRHQQEVIAAVGNTLQNGILLVLGHVGVEASASDPRRKP